MVTSGINAIEIESNSDIEFQDIKIEWFIVTFNSMCNNYKSENLLLTIIESG